MNNPGDYVLVIDKGRKSLAILIDALPKLLNEPTETERLSETNKYIDEFLKPGVLEGNNIWDQLEIKGLVDSMQDSKKF